MVMSSTLGRRGAAVALGATGRSDGVGATVLSRVGARVDVGEAASVGVTEETDGALALDGDGSAAPVLVGGGDSASAGSSAQRRVK